MRRQQQGSLIDNKAPLFHETEVGLRRLSLNGPDEEKRLAEQYRHQYRAFVTDLDGTIMLHRAADLIYRRVAHDGVVFATATGRDFEEHSRDIAELRRKMRSFHEDDNSPNKLNWPEVERRLLFGCIHGSRVYGGSYQPVTLEPTARIDFTAARLRLKMGEKEFFRRSAAWSIIESVAQGERVVISAEGSSKGLVDFALGLEFELRELIRRDKYDNVIGLICNPEDILRKVVVTDGKSALSLQPELVQSVELPSWATVRFLQQCLDACGLHDASPRMNSRECLAVSWKMSGSYGSLYGYSSGCMDAVDLDWEMTHGGATLGNDDTPPLGLGLDDSPGYFGLLEEIEGTRSSGGGVQRESRRTGQEVAAILNRHFEDNGIALAALAGHLNVDILSREANKLRVVEAAQKRVNLLSGQAVCKPEDVARAGDAGIPGGNDFAMLVGQGGFSVEYAAPGIPIVADGKGPLRATGGEYLLEILKFSGVR